MNNFSTMYGFAIVLLVTLTACGGEGGGGSSAGTPSVSGPFTVGGTVTGLTASGLVLRNNGADDRAIASDGSFTFATAVASGNAYSLTIADHGTHRAQDHGGWRRDNYRR